MAIATSYRPADRSGNSSLRRWRGVALFMVIFIVAVIPAESPAQTSIVPSDAPPATSPAGTYLEESQPSEQKHAASLPTRKKTDARVARWVRTLFWSMVLIVVFIFAAIVIVIFSRRYRAYLLRGRTTPTPSEDLWVKHKLPPEALSDLESPPDDKTKP
jgi:hypothetical protein